MEYKTIIVDLSNVQDEELFRKLLSEFRINKWTKNMLNGYWVKEFNSKDADWSYRQLEPLREHGLRLCLSSKK